MNGRRFWESRDTPDTEAPPAHDGLQSGGRRPVVAEQTPPASSTQAHAEGRVPWSQVPKRLGKPLKLDKPAAGHSEAAESRPGNSPLKAGDANPRLLSASESKPSTNASHVRKLAVKAASFNTPRISELKVFSASPPQAHTRIHIRIIHSIRIHTHAHLMPRRVARLRFDMHKALKCNLIYQDALTGMYQDARAQYFAQRSILATGTRRGLA